MDSSTSALVNHIASATWQALNSMPFRVHPIYLKHMSSCEAILQLISSVSITFSPGLLEVMQSSQPPAIEFFKSLDGETHKQWAIYLLVLEAPGQSPRIYIGSGTAFRDGVLSRLRKYSKKNTLPRFVEQSLEEGFDITHMGLLCWAPIPPVAAIVSSRTLFLALETTFSLAFWTMKPKDIVGLSALCPWIVHELPYTGLCSHFSMQEPPAGTIDMTIEEIEAVGEAVMANHNEHKREMRKKRRATDEVWAEKERAMAREYYSRSYIRNPERYLVNNQRCRAKNLAENKFPCNDCKVRFRDNHDLQKHLKTDLHLYGEREREPLEYYCDICDMKFTGERATSKFAAHKDFSKTHHRKAGTNVASTAKILRCDVCGTEYTSRTAYDSHFTSETHYRNSGLDPSTAPKSYLCVDCGKGYSAGSSLHKHRKTCKARTDIAPPEIWRCDPCDREYTSKTGYDSHLNSAMHYRNTGQDPSTAPKPCLCDDCGKRFSEAACLRRHRKTFHSD